MLLLVGTPQNLQKVLPNFLSFFWNFGHIWKLLESTEPFRGVLQTSFIFSEYDKAIAQRMIHLLNRQSEIEKLVFNGQIS